MTLRTTMKIKVNTVSWKKAVSQTLSLVNKKSGNPNETAVGIRISEGVVELVTVDNGNHNSTIVFKDILSIEEDDTEYYIQFSSLDKLNKVNVDEKELEIRIEEGKLVYAVDKLGEISESLYHNQQPFKGLLFNVEEYDLISEGNSNLIKALKSALKNITDKDINFTLAKEKSYINGGLGLSSEIKIEFETEVEANPGLTTTGRQLPHH